MLSIIRTLSRITFATTAFVSTLSTAVDAEANGPLCSELFQSDSPNFQASENFRLKLLGEAKIVLKSIRKERMANTIQFQLQIERRGEVSRSRVVRDMEGSATLSRLDMIPSSPRDGITIAPPEISSSTMELIQDVRVDLDKVLLKLNQDPYFSWLKHNALRYQASQKDDLRKIDRSRGPITDQANPVFMFVKYRKEGLSPDLALIRVMRNFDPVLSPIAVHASNNALYHSGLEAVLVDKIIPSLSSRKSQAEGDAWSLMTSLVEGRKNLRDLLSQQAAKYGKLFSRAAYERAAKQLESGDTSMNVIFKYRSQRYLKVPEQQIVSDLKPELVVLMDQLGISKDFPMERLYNILERTHTIQGLGSYESVLADIFDPKAGAMIRDLRFITEIAQGFTSEGQAHFYLHSLVEP